MILSRKKAQACANGDKEEGASVASCLVADTSILFCEAFTPALANAVIAMSPTFLATNHQLISLGPNKDPKHPQSIFN